MCSPGTWSHRRPPRKPLAAQARCPAQHHSWPLQRREHSGGLTVFVERSKNFASERHPNNISAVTVSEATRALGSADGGTGYLGDHGDACDRHSAFPLLHGTCDATLIELVIKLAVPACPPLYEYSTAPELRQERGTGTPGAARQRRPPAENPADPDTQLPGSLPAAMPTTSAS
jgi:hypothetical protein